MLVSSSLQLDKGMKLEGRYDVPLGTIEVGFLVKIGIFLAKKLQELKHVMTIWYADSAIYLGANVSCALYEFN